MAIRFVFEAKELLLYVLGAYAHVRGKGIAKPDVPDHTEQGQLESDNDGQLQPETRVTVAPLSRVPHIRHDAPIHRHPRIWM